jgi:hypothetical protein
MLMVSPSVSTKQNRPVLIGFFSNVTDFTMRRALLNSHLLIENIDFQKGENTDLQVVGILETTDNPSLLKDFMDIDLYIILYLRNLINHKTVKYYLVIPRDFNNDLCDGYSLFLNVDLCKENSSFFTQD